MIRIDRELCVGCGRCAWDCFPGAITLEETAVLSQPDACIGCGHCVAVCPVSAVCADDLPGDDIIPCRNDVAPEDLLTLMRSRRSCRHYRSEPVPEDTLSQLLSAARACPTAKNLQATRYIAVRENIPALLDLALEVLGEAGIRQLESASAPDEKRRAGNFIRWREMRRQDPAFDPLFFHAPALLLFVSPKETAHDAAGAAAYTELMAASMGLGCLYSGYFTACAAMSPAIRERLGVGDGERVVRCLVLGYPDVSYPRTAPRKPPEVTYL